ncbi:MAG TPA: hypothetical protein VFZ16_16730 [Hyphomicrobiaceae bacterium]|nr:hypothetical protein [Hyphomicrobiaceae bacterium]
MPRVPKKMTIVTMEGDEGNLQAKTSWLSLLSNPGRNSDVSARDQWDLRMWKALRYGLMEVVWLVMIVGGLSALSVALVAALAAMV